MKKRIPIRGTIGAESFSDEAGAILLTIDQADIVPLCLNLLLLDYALVEVLELHQETSRTSLALSRAANATLLRSAFNGTNLAIEIRQNDLQSIVSFLLQFYRDGYWEVNHVDIELATPAGAHRDVMFTVQTLQTPRAISGDDLKKLLGFD
jgi:hypothetical protein